MTQRTLRWLRIPVNDKVCHSVIDRFHIVEWTTRVYCWLRLTAAPRPKYVILLTETTVFHGC